MTDHVQEQEMEIEALEAILMDDFQEIHPSESGLNTSNRCFQITLSPQDDDADESSTTPVQLGFIFSHTEKYPDEIPLLNVKSIRGIHTSDLKVLKEKLEQEASENLGMATKEALSIGSDLKPPVLFRGEYPQWKKRFLHFIKTQELAPEILDSLENGVAVFYEHVIAAPNAVPPVIGGRFPIPPSRYTAAQKQRAKADVQANLFMLQGLPNEIYNSLDSFETGKELWDEIRKQMGGTGNKSKMVSTLNSKMVSTLNSKMVSTLNSYGQFKATPGEELQSTYHRYCNLLNDLRKNNLKKENLEINIKFINILLPEWEMFGNSAMQHKDLSQIDIHELYEYLQQNEPIVKNIAKNRQETADTLALLTKQYHSYVSAKLKEKMEEPEPVSTDDLEKELQDVLRAMSLLSNYQKKYYSRPTNNNLRSSSNFKSAPSATNPTEKPPMTPLDPTKKCYNCGIASHFSRDCKKPKIHDSEYYKRKMLMAKQVETGKVLLAEDLRWMEESYPEDEEHATNLCFMARENAEIVDRFNEEANKDIVVIVPHGELVTINTYLSWRD